MGVRGRLFVSLYLANFVLLLVSTNQNESEGKVLNLMGIKKYFEVKPSGHANHFINAIITTA